ncbi:hypothetical protein ABIG07_001406 [Bradyrhizobium ottawaense]|uniref:Uncharacterized protein n=1 Tax=Bradyrhizobium ottawaense TaxID=931866 RepID=A0ABV4FLK4_9BRAD
MTSDSPARSRRLSTIASGVLMRLGEAARAGHAADVGRDHHGLGEVEPLLDVAHHQWRGVEVVGRNVEEALDLAGVQIERHDAVDTGLRDQVGDQLGRDRRARARLTVLPGVAEIGQHRRDAARRGAAQRVGDDQQFHQMVVRRERGRLDDEGIRAAHVLLDLDEDLHVGEAPHHRLGQRQVQALRDRLREGRIGVAGDELDGAVFGRHRRFLPRFAGYDVQHLRSHWKHGYDGRGNIRPEAAMATRDATFSLRNPESGQRLGRNLRPWFSGGYRSA